MAPVRKNIILVTWFGTPNYGTTLQAYALYAALEERGFNVRILRRFKEPFTARNIKDNFFYAHGIRRFWKYAPQPFPSKMRKIRRFCRASIRTSVVCTAADLRRLLEDTDIFVAGSDQLWNCYDHFRGFEFLAFAPGKKKIAYASSIGAKDIPPEYREKVKEYLSEFRHISVREPSGASFLASLTGREDIVPALDPVLLQKSRFWEEEADKADRRILRAFPSAGYTLYYILGKTRPGEEFAWPADTDVSRNGQAIIVPSGENPDFSIPGALVADRVGIREFIALFRGASRIVTDSFHGTALSIAFQKQFINLARFSDRDPASQNIRLHDLLSNLEIGDRTWQGVPLPRIDYDAVQKRLERIRAQSESFLEKALSDEV